MIRWLTGYDAAGLARQIERGVDFTAFFDEAPAIHPNAGMVKGVVCGVRVEDVPDPLMKRIRQLDKLVRRVETDPGDQRIHVDLQDMRDHRRNQKQLRVEGPRMPGGKLGKGRGAHH